MFDTSSFYLSVHKFMGLLFVFVLEFKIFSILV